ncbi:MAG: ABC transporter permease [Campylobacterales bacterium]|nr:ABC transporter permease [Campylobacterales bacterium]
MLGAILKKEWLLLIRNPHALAVLFVMPTVFIVVMSLALENTYAQQYDVKMNVALVGDGTSSRHEALVKSLEANRFFVFTHVEHKNAKEALLGDKRYEFAVDIEEGEAPLLRLYARAGMAHQQVVLLEGVLRSAALEVAARTLAIQAGISPEKIAGVKDAVQSVYLQENAHSITMTSAQHSVPSWLIFAMFFILIPLSNTLINEKNAGTLERIQSMNVAPSLLMAGKMLPYFFINQVQLVVMIGVGMVVLPLLGGEAFVFEGSGLTLLVASFAVSFAAISFALMIAVISPSTEVATLLGGTFNIVLAALGGIMVPTVVMPESMQAISQMSPMFWALDAFVGAMVRGASLVDVGGSVVKLCLFSLACLGATYAIARRQKG